MPDAAQVDEAIRSAAAFLEQAAAELAPRTAAEIHAGVPDLPAALAVTGQSTAGVRELISAIARAVLRGTEPEALVVPEQTLEHARMYVRRGVELPVLLRTYRVGHGVMWRLWTDAVDDQADDPDTRLALRDRAAEKLFGFMDAVTGRVVEEYHAERERWSRSAAARRAATVRDLLDGQPVDPAAAGRTLGRELAGRHVGAVLWTATGEDAAGAPARLERAAAEVAVALGDPRPLLVPVGHRVLWMWATPGPAADHEPAGPAATALRGDRVSVALGEPASGVDGFRHSHEEAVAARRVAVVAGRRPGATTRWQRSGLLGLLAVDAELAARFARRELGELDADDDATARLRATLATFLREGAHVARTAERLGVHPNTVGNRLRQCETALGRTIDHRRMELQAALLIRDGLGGG
ncbi:PucR family transcriptional regulator [Patulibacter defluvii]|uniref:PucR family transcriptional regulator n=1 Tax=Patulibacter defluvii TaxID=3095358 RepID=UPI002A7568EE|nr:helix-turn-helix domain-containing protein [Patulibacter sp. DM4]